VGAAERIAKRTMENFIVVGVIVVGVIVVAAPF
jgi:hypothetical protein